MKTNIKAFLVFILCVVMQGINAQSPNELKAISQFNCEQNIVYKIVGGDTLTMNIFYPKVKSAKKMPIMLYTHGGGWGGGTKNAILGRDFVTTLKILNEHGIACAAIDYRLTRKGISTVYDCVVDCKDAARFLMQNATKFSLDINKMGVWGGSAGGHLSLMTALGKNSDFVGDTKLSRYKPHFVCVASYFPLTSFVKSEYLLGSNFEKPARFIELFGGLISENKEMAKTLSPAEILTKNAPPILLLHGDNDKILPIAQSNYMMEVAQKVGANVSLLVVKNGGHSFNGDNISPSMEEINRYSADFIMKYLLKK